ncbi:DUF6089 family protein [Formosa sp. S-31]|uniref:type IX secretion system protein PorG n=1 Tax=Formosa sp. S-31 TaxID=2790949 RepID=UPI003EBA62B4
MRYITIFIISIFFLQSNYAQNYEIGVFLGGSNIIGDVGSTYYINPNSPAFGGILKWNRSPRHSWRITGIITDLEADDLKSDDPKRKARGLNFTDRTIGELSAGLEYTFFDFDLHKSGHPHTPYIYSGLSAALQRDFYFDGNSKELTGTKGWILGIPITLGYKYRITGGFIIAAEVGARYTFSDALDGSNPKDDYLKEEYSFGNLNNNDWYVFTGITITYTFGRNPCYCIN